MRRLYSCILWLHPPAFRRQFAGEMLWIFDQAYDAEGAVGLFCDGLISLARQWLVRSGSWKVAIAVALALIQILLGGYGTVMFGPHRLIRTASAPGSIGLAEFLHQGALAHQPLTVGVLMWLALSVLCGLVLMIVGLTCWTKAFSLRRRPAVFKVH